MTEITVQDWCDIANEAEPQPSDKPQWVTCDCPVGGEFVALSDLSIGYSPWNNKAQQLRIADYLAEKGVFIFNWRNCFYAYQFHKAGIWPCNMRLNFPVPMKLSQHGKVNECRALAVLALRKDGE